MQHLKVLWVWTCLWEEHVADIFRVEVSEVGKVASYVEVGGNKSDDGIWK
jgi:hypothetical protein